MRGIFIGPDSQFLVREPAGREMLDIGRRLPFLDLLKHVRHVRNELKQHHHFIEMVQVVGRQQGGLVDIGPPDQQPVGLGKARLCLHRGNHTAFPKQFRCNSMTYRCNSLRLRVFLDN